MRSAHHGSFVPEAGGAIGQRNRFPHALGSCAGDQQFLRGGVLRYPFPELHLFVAGERHAFAGGTADDIARQTRQVPLFNIVLNFDFPNIAFGIERRGYRRKNTLEFQHDRLWGRLLALLIGTEAGFQPAAG